MGVIHESLSDYTLKDSTFSLFFVFVLIFFPFIFISSRLITLQYCSGFCHTLT